MRHLPDTYWPFQEQDDALTAITHEGQAKTDQVENRA